MKKKNNKAFSSIQKVFRIFKNIVDKVIFNSKLVLILDKKNLLIKTYILSIFRLMITINIFQRVFEKIIIFSIIKTINKLK